MRFNYKIAFFIVLSMFITETLLIGSLFFATATTFREQIEYDQLDLECLNICEKNESCGFYYVDEITYECIQLTEDEAIEFMKDYAWK